MNMKQLIAAAFILSAVNAAQADQSGEGRITAAKSRAQVVTELQPTAAPEIKDVSTQPGKSRADVRAELILAQDKIKANRGQRGD